jgi:N utilization substance protein A
MNINLLEALDTFEREKGISRDILVDIIQKSIKSAYKKNYGTKNVEVEMDDKLSKLNVYQVWHVVEEVKEEKKIDHKAKLGSIIRKKINLKKDFKRIAAQTAKQVILQNIKELEKKALYEKYVSLKDKITNAEIIKVNPNFAEIRIGKLETKLPEKEMIPGEELTAGDLVKVHVKDIQQTTEGLVDIVKIYREPGVRTKVAVKSNDPDVDAVGACIGENSMRINELISELKVEKVDIISYSEDPEQFIKNALAPAEVKKIIINEEENHATVFVPETQFSLAIGKGGQTARTAAKITGWKIDIHTVEE